MFLKDFKAQIDYDAILKKEHSDLPIFRKLQTELKSLDINSVLVTAVDRTNSYYTVQCESHSSYSHFYSADQSYYRDIPILTVFYINEKNQHYEIPVTEQLRDSIKCIWKTLLIEEHYEIEHFYDEEMYIDTVNFTSIYFLSKLYELRTKIQKKISRLKIISPQKIYYSPIPAFTVYYKNAEDYYSAKESNDFQLINQAIQKVVNQHLHKEFRYLSDSFDIVQFIHPEINGLSFETM